MQTIFKKIHSYWLKRKKYDKFLILIFCAYLLISGIFLILHKSPYTPDQFFIFAFVVVIFTGRAKIFLRDWTQPILLILAYEYLRSVIPKTNPHVYFKFMIDFDKFIFGQLPTVYLQNLLFSISHLHWYDYFGALLYSSHFTIPLFVAFIFWLYDKSIFKNYIFSIALVSYMGFLTYLLFPAAPPWLASEQGMIFPPLQHINNIVFGHFSGSISLPTVYKYLGANLVAAVPSLHAAYPLLTSLFLVKKHPKSLVIMAIYIFAIWFFVIYSGDHYFFDVVLGAIYALVAYYVVKNWGKLKKIRLNHGSTGNN